MGEVNGELMMEELQDLSAIRKWKLRHKFDWRSIVNSPEDKKDQKTFYASPQDFRRR